MSVEHDILCAALSGFDNVDDERRHAFRLENLPRNSLDLQSLDSLIDLLYCLFHLSIREELGVVVGRKVRDADEILQSWNVPRVPFGLNVGISLGLVNCGKLLRCSSFDHICGNKIFIITTLHIYTTQFIRR